MKYILNIENKPWNIIDGRQVQNHRFEFEQILKKEISFEVKKFTIIPIGSSLDLSSGKNNKILRLEIIGYDQILENNEATSIIIFSKITKTYGGQNKVIKYLNEKYKQTL